MIKIHYDDIKNKIKENYIQGLCFETEYKDDTQRKAILSLALGKKEYCAEDINTLIEFSSNEYKIYDYESRNVLPNQIRKNFLVSKDYLPILKLEHYGPQNSSIDYSEDTYIIYQEGSNRIGSKISITSLKTEDFEDTSVVVLDSDELCSTKYYQKKYHFIIKDDDMLSLRIGNEMFLNGEEGFSIRYENALKCIGKVLSKITQKIEQTTEDDVKEYSIKSRLK